MSEFQPRKVDLDAVRTRRARIQREIELLRAEDQELMVAEAALVRLSELLAIAGKEQKAPGGKSVDSGGDQHALPAKSENTDVENAEGASAPTLVAPPVDASPKPQKNSSPIQQPVSQTGWVRPLSQRDYILMALDQSEEMWLGSREIQAFVQQRWGVELPTQSMRPLLTNMKQRGDIVRRGRVIASVRRTVGPESGALTKTSARA